MKNKSIKNFVLKEKETVKKIYIDAALILDELTKEGVDNLIKTGFADKDEISNIIGPYFSTLTNLNFKNFNDLSAHERMSYIYEYFYDFNQTCFYADEEEMDLIDEVFSKAMSNLRKNFPQVDFTKAIAWTFNNTDELTCLINYFIEKHIQNRLSDMQYFSDKKKSTELKAIFNFFKKNNIKVKKVTRNIAIDGEYIAKESSFLFGNDRDANDFIGYDDEENIEIQLEEMDLIERPDGDFIDLMLVFKDKEICNELGKLMSSKFNKKISISSQKRMSSDKHKSYYLEFSIDWRTEKNLINTIKNKIINFFILA